jgi:hypothetical protein
MEIMKMQEGLIQWFHYQEDREITFGKIENICIKLYEQHFPDKAIKNAKYDIFYPLLRYGVIEFSGNNKFGLSPTSVLVNRKYCLGFNLPSSVLEQLLEVNLVEIFPFIYLFDKDNKAKKILEDQNIEYSTFELSLLLKQIQPINKIVSSWREHSISDQNGFEYFNSRNTWTNQFNQETIGLFRTTNEVFARRLLKIDTYKWLNVSDRSSHIDSFNIAVCWSIINNNQDLSITYHHSDSILKIRNIYFPILIERLLFFNHCLNHGDFASKNYRLQAKDLKLLNKFFNNKIKTDE